MYGTLVVNSWVGIHDGCQIDFNVNGSGGTFVTVTGKTEPFELFFGSESLRAFLDQGRKALAEMDALAEQEAGGAGKQAESCEAGGKVA
jgi:hypothetical protein